MPSGGVWLNPLDLRRKSVKSETKSETQRLPLIVRHLVPRKLPQVQILPRQPKMNTSTIWAIYWKMWVWLLNPEIRLDHRPRKIDVIR